MRGRPTSGRTRVVTWCFRSCSVTGSGASRRSSLSHAHLDHVGGAPAVLEEVPADVILDPGEPVAEPHYLALLDLAGARASAGSRPGAGDSLVIDGVRIPCCIPTRPGRGGAPT